MLIWVKILELLNEYKNDQISYEKLTMKYREIVENNLSEELKEMIDNNQQFFIMQAKHGDKNKTITGLMIENYVAQASEYIRFLIENEEISYQAFRKQLVKEKLVKNTKEYNEYVKLINLLESSDNEKKTLLYSWLKNTEKEKKLILIEASIKINDRTNNFSEKEVIREKNYVYGTQKCFKVK